MVQPILTLTNLVAIIDSLAITAPPTLSGLFGMQSIDRDKTKAAPLFLIKFLHAIQMLWDGTIKDTPSVHQGGCLLIIGIEKGHLPSEHEIRNHRPASLPPQ